MKKLLITLLIFAVIGGAAFGAYKVLGSGDSESNIFQDIKEKFETVVNKEEDFSGSLVALMGRGKSLKCTYKQTEEVDGVEAEGVIYVADNNVHTEIDIIGEEEGTEDVRMDMIINGDWVYVWTSAQVNGMKMKIVDLPEGEDFDADEDITDLEEEIDMKCRLWIKDSSKFDVPTDIEFDDVTEMMEEFEDYDSDEVKEETEDMVTAAQEQLCAMCETALTQELIDQCKIDAGCE